jgi:hypothetical protein
MVMKIGSKGCMDVVLGKARLSPLEVFFLADFEKWPRMSFCMSEVLLCMVASSLQLTEKK